MTRIIPLLLILVLACIWGSSFILMKTGLQHYSPIQVACMRLIFAGLVLSPFFYKSLKNLRKTDARFIVIIALCGNGIPAFLFTYAQTHLGSAITGALNSLTPVFTLLISLFIIKIKPGIVRIIGVAIGFVGAVMLILSQGSFAEQPQYGYTGLVVFATLLYAISVSTIKYRLSDYSSIHIASIPIVFLAIPCAFYLGFAEPISSTDLFDGGLKSILATAVLGIFGTAISLVLFNRLIILTTAVVATSVTYLMPVVALFWGFRDNEPITALQIAGLAVVLVGVYLTNLNTKSVKPAVS